MSRRLTLAALTGVALLLAGCASGAPSTTGSATPEPSATTVTTEVAAAWLDGGAQIAVLVPGSSTCLPMAEEATYEAGVLSVSLVDPADTACTRDLVLRGIAVAAPAGVDPAQALTVEVAGSGYTGSVELPGVAGMTPTDGLMDGLPSAGWTTQAGSFALLTWGSSSCRPQLQDASVTAPGEISVTFATPPADQVCTADMAPRVTVVDVPDVEPGVAYTAVLSGDGSTAVPIAGVN